MSDQTPDSAEQIAKDAVQYLPMPAVDYPPLRASVVARINAFVHAAEERAKAEQAAKVRAALCPMCRDGVRLVAQEPGGYHSWLHVTSSGWPVGYCEAPDAIQEIHAILGTPTGGPDGLGK